MMEVHSHIGHEFGAWEISLIDPDFEHGHKSWGWFGTNKLPVSCVDSWMTRDISIDDRKALYEAALAAAHSLLPWKAERDS